MEEKEAEEEEEKGRNKEQCDKCVQDKKMRGGIWKAGNEAGR